MENAKARNDDGESLTNRFDTGEIETVHRFCVRFWLHLIVSIEVRTGRGIKRRRRARSAQRTSGAGFLQGMRLRWKRMGVWETSLHSMCTWTTSAASSTC